MSAYYAANAGRQTGVFATWSECQQQVQNYAGARFKKFDSKDAAENFVKNPTLATVHCSVDVVLVLVVAGND
jgi:viroplasmin and RNaseH domain-containing protein